MQSERKRSTGLRRRAFSGVHSPQGCRSWCGSRSRGDPCSLHGMGSHDTGRSVRCLCYMLERRSSAHTCERWPASFGWHRAHFVELTAQAAQKCIPAGMHRLESRSLQSRSKALVATNRAVDTCMERDPSSLLKRGSIGSTCARSQQLKWLETEPGLQSLRLTRAFRDDNALCLQMGAASTHFLGCGFCRCSTTQYSGCWLISARITRCIFKFSIRRLGASSFGTNLSARNIVLLTQRGQIAY